MLNDKWIIADKEYINKTREYLYTLVAADCYKSTFKTTHLHLCSDQEYRIGDFRDSDLNPLNEQYDESKTDIATVVCSKQINPVKQFKRIALFGKYSGYFFTNVDTGKPGLPVKRGDTVSVFKYNDPRDEAPTAQASNFLMFNMMYNHTTGAKHPAYEYIVNNNEGVFEDVIITGVNSLNETNIPASRWMLVESPKFGYVSMDVKPSNLLVFSRPGDKLLVERVSSFNDYTQYNVLRNITTDNMLTELVLSSQR